MSHAENITSDIPQAIEHQLTVRLHLDEGPPNPRKEFDAYARLWIRDNREFSDIDDAPDDIEFWWIGDDDDPRLGAAAVSWDEPEAIAAAMRRRGYAVVGIYLDDYNHELRPSDDSRADGFGYMSRADILKMHTYEDKHPQRVTAKMRDAALETIRGEIETYSAWASGDVWGVVISEQDTDEDGDPTGIEEDLDSCWGFYGYTYAKEEAARMVAEVIAGREEHAAA